MATGQRAIEQSTFRDHTQIYQGDIRYEIHLPQGGRFKEPPVFDNFGHSQLGTDLSQLASQFKNESVRFEQWREAVGIDKHGKLSDNHDEALDDPQTRSQVLSTFEEVLSIIRELSSDVDDTVQQPFPEVDILPTKTGLLPESPIPPHRTTLSETNWSRLSGTLRSKIKHLERVGQFGEKVQNLHNLLSLEDAEGTRTRDRVFAPSSFAIGRSTGA